eukprot:UN13107
MIVIAYSISVFRFANSGFFSLNGGAAWLPILGIIIKFGIGAKVAQVGFFTAKYDALKRAFGDVSHGGGIGDSSAGVGGDNYNMETIDVNKEDDD